MTTYARRPPIGSGKSGRIGKLIETGRALLFGATENNDYGNTAILNEYSRVPIGTPVIGRIQHGWECENELGHYYKNNLLDTFVWNQNSQSVSRALGWRNFTAIGAPWLYLLHTLEEDGWKLPKAESVNARPIKELWVYGSHSTKFDDGRDKSLPEFLHAVETSTAERKKVLLYYIDFDKLTPELLMKYAHLEIVTLGPRRRSSTANSHLFQLFQLLQQVEVLVTDYPTTLILYAASMGCQITWFKNSSHTAGIEMASRAKHFSVVDVLNQTSLMPFELHDFTLEHLGASSMKSVTEMRELFGWNEKGLTPARRTSKLAAGLLLAPSRYLDAKRRPIKNL